MFDELMLPKRAELSHQKDGRPTASLRIRLPWYRSLPISCVEQLNLTIDGKPISREDVSVSFGDTYHTLDEAALLSDVSWFVLDEAVALFKLSDELVPGMHDVGLSLTLRIPYTEPEFWPIDFTQTAIHAQSIEFLGRDS